MSPSMSSSGDRRQLSAGKSHLFREIFLSNSVDLLRFLSRKVGPSDAPDLLQETFVRFLQKDQIDPVVDPPPFLQKIAINLARDFARRRKTEAKYLKFSDPPEGVRSDEILPDVLIEASQQWRLICASIETLSPRCREVFILYMRDGLALGEIARRLGISRNMAQKHMRLALARCWAALE